MGFVVYVNVRCLFVVDDDVVFVVVMFLWKEMIGGDIRMGILANRSRKFATYCLRCILFVVVMMCLFVFIMFILIKVLVLFNSCKFLMRVFMLVMFLGLIVIFTIVDV